jgi:hypothetical protein
VRRTRSDAPRASSPALITSITSRIVAVKSKRIAASSGSASYAASRAADGCVCGHSAPVVMMVTPASFTASWALSSGTHLSIRPPSTVISAMLARLYRAATSSETLRSSTAA